MASSPITSVTSKTNTNSTSGTTGKTNVDNDDFMTLLLAELKNQDPLKPMDSSEMMGQIAQLNSLNALLAMQKSIDAMNASQTLTYASNLIGKNIVSIPDKNDPTKFISGVVTSMTTGDGKTMVQVNNQDVEISTIVEVSEG
jgi:flagellar basal-body rod modification protein FlgD